MTLVFNAPAPVTAPVFGSDQRFPVARIFCVGRNYAAHVREMGLDPAREPPFFFMKPTDALVESGERVPYPPNTSDFQYEIELVVAIGVGGSGIAISDALAHVWGYGVGIDLTRRDRQIEARKAGRPWEVGKSFERSAPLGMLHQVTDVGHPDRGRIWLTVNGQPRQDSDIEALIWSVPEIVSALSRSWDLVPGDLIYTGTPDGVGPVVPGDTISGGVAGLSEIGLTII